MQLFRHVSAFWLMVDYYYKLAKFKTSNCSGQRGLSSALLHINYEESRNSYFILCLCGQYDATL